MRIEGIADLPLHYGHVPQWLAKIMKELAKAILDIILLEFRSEGLLKRLSNPYWFQAFNNAIGMDWDSSGSTTVTTAIVKEALRELGADVGVAGGKGPLSRKTQGEIDMYGELMGLRDSILKHIKEASILGAKADSTLLQDGFSLYHHTIFFDKRGRWVIIQQGMNVKLRLARRYHLAWFSSHDPTINPHTAVLSDLKVISLNLTDLRSLNSRKIIVDLINEGASKVKNLIVNVNACLKGLRPLTGEELVRPIDRNLPYYRPIRLTRRLLLILRKAYEVKPRDIKELMLWTNVGPETLRALALISELIYREPPSLNDPVTHPFSPFKYAFTIGGKDGVPHPVKREVAISVIRELRRIINDAKVGDKEKLIALKALSRLAPRDLLGI